MVGGRFSAPHVDVDPGWLVYNLSSFPLLMFQPLKPSRGETRTSHQTWAMFARCKLAGQRSKRNDGNDGNDDEPPICSPSWIRQPTRRTSCLSTKGQGQLKKVNDGRACMMLDGAPDQHASGWDMGPASTEHLQLPPPIALCRSPWPQLQPHWIHAAAALLPCECRVWTPSSHEAREFSTHPKHVVRPHLHTH